MAVVAIDTSGQIVRNPDVWIVAIRKQNQIQHTGIHINQDFQNEFRNISKNWVDKLYATLFFKTSNTLLRSHDIIQIDKDFQGKRAAHVRHYRNVSSEPSTLVLREPNPLYSFCP